MNQEEFARRTQAMRQTLYRTAYLYLGREADALEVVDEAVYQALRALGGIRSMNPCCGSWSPPPRLWTDVWSGRRPGSGLGAAGAGFWASRPGLWRPALRALCCW